MYSSYIEVLTEHLQKKKDILYMVYPAILINYAYTYKIHATNIQYTSLFNVILKV